MAVRQTLICDWTARKGSKPCGEEATITIKFKIDSFDYTGHFCVPHAGAFQNVVRAHGMQLHSAVTNQHRRKAFVTASGQTFTVADARTWLIQEGRLPKDKTRGRLSRELIDEYAANH